MKRREFITFLVGSMAAWPSVAPAQQQKGKVWRVGYLNPGSGSFAAGRSSDPWVGKLRELGYVEGLNFVVEARSAEGNGELLPSLAKELIALKPDVIVGNGTPAIFALQKLSSTVPIIMAPVNDPVGSGFVKSLAHPGGNITGLANMSSDYMPKMLELLRELVPGAKRVAVLMSSNVAHAMMYQTADKAATSIGIELVPAMARNEGELDRVFLSIADAKCDALIVLSDPPRPRIVALAAAARIPAIYQDGQYVNEGGLAGYGPNFGALIAQAAIYLDKIFKGANPGDLPIEQPTIFALKINLKTAKALGLEVAPVLVGRADEVIE
jgi:putative tryptophan/tyrosine transport system substrate-binding protein